MTSGIESFKGLHITDNPFVASQGSASDILNLYIDETNKLVTRPRLDFAYDIAVNDRFGTYIDSAHFDTYTIFLYKTSEGVKLTKRKESNGEISDITPIDGYVISDKRLKCFEKDDVLYFLDGLVSNGKYYYAYLDDSTPTPTLEVVSEFYVPTTTVGRTSLAPGNKYEPLNSLINKYRESWRWDGTWGIVDVDDTTSVIKDKGTFINQTVFDKNGVVMDTEYPIVKMNKTGYMTLNTNIFECYDYNGNLIKTYDLGDTFNASTDIYAVSEDFKLFTWVDVGVGTWTQCIHHSNVTIWNTVDKEGHTFGDKFITISEDKSMILLIINQVYNDGMYVNEDSILRKAIFNPSSETPSSDYVFSETLNDYCLKHPMLNSDGTSVIVFANRSYSDMNSLDPGIWRLSNLKTSVESQALIDSDFRPPLSWSLYDSRLALFRTNGLLIYDNIFDTVEITKLDITVNMFSNLYLYDNTLWFIDKTAHVLYIVKNLDDIPTYNIFSITDGVDLYHNSEIRCGTDYQYFIRRRDDATPTKYITFTLDIDNPLQEVIYEKIVDVKHPDYADWNKLNSTKEFATMFTNFMTNYYVAQGKLLRASMYNNPLYFPITEYNEFNEDITGLNRLGDTLLAVYSSKNIYLQHPIYDESGGYKMASTETKAIKGNVAVNAPTVTYYSNYPVHIGKDGIYALQLEENVQSSERITVLITEGINRKLLDETLTNCITFNNSYYTYFVFPLTTDSHIYLLDNRTNEWFYWEMPIKIISMFEKDNKVYMMNEAGMVYRLEKEDELTDSNNPITIYSDEIASGEKITIPWLWRSQIMILSHITNPKQLYSTSFIMLDDDAQDNYGLTYKFTAFKKYFTSNTESLLTSGSINYIKTVTRRTYLSAFNFLQLELTNPLDDSVTVFDEQDSNKLNLVAIIFKYKVLPGGI